MKVSLNWLNRWVDVSGIDPQELADRLTMAGLEVDAVEHLGEGLDDIVVGRIESIGDHPQADRLVMCVVDAGEGTPRNIVCGAKNMSAGDLVPVALPGSQPPALDFEIEEREVMGEVSQGMLCAADELGLADESDGLMLLDGDYVTGTPIVEALELRDVVLHLDLTPNRSDCQSHLGVAREIAALYDLELRDIGEESTPAWTDGDGDIGDVAALVVEDEEGCPRYAMAVMEGIDVGPSPDWLVRHLAAIGTRSVNNIVDATNFVLQDVGQPLHAFDLDELTEQRIVVRRAGAGETILGIDHNEYELEPEDLVIADAARPVAIAGVMGGEETEVSETTSRILIECAYFDPTTVRRTAKRHSLHTESSHRFERGVDPNGLIRHLQLAVEIIAKTQEDVDGVESRVRRGIVDNYPAPIEPPRIEVSEELFTRILGIEVPTDEIREHLESIGLEVTVEGDTLSVTTPTFRPDLERPIDLVEEVARLHGYDEFEATLPHTHMGREHVLRDDPRHGATLVTREAIRRRRTIRTFLLGEGLHEAVNYSFMSTEQLDRLRLSDDDPRRDAVKVANPLTKDQEWMRTTMVPGLLRTLETNLAQRIQDVAIFEMGRCYEPDGERRVLTLLATGDVDEHYSDDRQWDFYDLKGFVESIGLPFDTEGVEWVQSDVEPYLHPGVQARWERDGATLAVVGQVHPRVLQNTDVETPVFVAEVELDRIFGLGSAERTFQRLPRYPAVRRDFAFLYDRDAAYAELEREIHALAAENDDFGEIFESVSLFDVYEGAQVPDGKRSLALEVVYRSPDRTLTDDEVAEADRHLVGWLDDRLNASLR